MIIRYGEYTIYNSIEMSITEYYGHGLSQEIDEHHRVIAYSAEYGQIEKFQFYEDSNSYRRDIRIEELQNAFYIITKAFYKGLEFILEPGLIDELIVLRSDNESQFKELGYEEYIVGDEKKMSELELNSTRYFKVHNGYIISSKIKLMDKILEERFQSQYKLPLPDGLELIKEIKIQNDFK
jgi:hypothetical protein